MDHSDRSKEFDPDASAAAVKRPQQVDDRIELLKLSNVDEAELADSRITDDETATLARRRSTSRAAGQTRSFRRIRSGYGW